MQHQTLAWPIPLMSSAIHWRQTCLIANSNFILIYTLLPWFFLYFFYIAFDIPFGSSPFIPYPCKRLITLLLFFLQINRDPLASYISLSAAEEPNLISAPGLHSPCSLTCFSIFCWPRPSPGKALQCWYFLASLSSQINSFVSSIILFHPLEVSYLSLFTPLENHFWKIFHLISQYFLPFF